MFGKKRSVRLTSRKVLVSRLQCCTKEYFNETSLHGFRYIFHPKSSKFKSFFWALICITSTVLCVRLITFQYNNYYSNRISTTISTTAFPIWEVPFPAVTVCNFNVVYKDAVEQFRKLLENDFSDDLIDNFFGNLSYLLPSNSNDNDFSSQTFPKITQFLRKNGYNTDELMSKLAQPCEKLLTECYWSMKEISCGTLFVKTKTNSGYCCSFNYKAVIEDDLLNKQDPIYVQGVGPTFGLSATLNVELSQYVSPIKQNQGIEVAIHESIQYPDMSIYSATIYPGNDVSLSLKPEITESEPRTRDIDMKTRGCAFEDEVPLEWSKSYSYTTCMNQCKARAIHNLCGCVPFYYSFGRYTRICSLLDIVCFRKNSAKFKRSNFAGSFLFIDTDSEAEVNRNPLGDASGCKCIPPCNEVSYSFQVDQQAFSSSEVNVNLSSLQVYFGHVSCTKISRTVFMTWESVLAAIGGLIGLCLGGSILSIIEFFYHIIDSICSRQIKRKAVNLNHEPKLYMSDFPQARKKHKWEKV